MDDRNLTPIRWSLLAVILFACAVNYPCLHWGLQFGDDHNLHITYLNAFEEQLQAGELYPHWMSPLNFGAGSPIFFVQYPLPFYVAAALHRVFRMPATPNGYAHALGLFMFLAGVISGLSSWLWCRTLASPAVAILASAIYLTMPYVYGCDVYVRGAIGEYGALAWVPMALCFAHSVNTRPRRAVAGMAFAFAMILFSNFLTALLFAPFLTCYILSCSAPIKKYLALSSAGVALLLGLGVASVYMLPMNANRSFFHFATLLQVGPDIFYYRDHLFPFSGNLFPMGNNYFDLIDIFCAMLGLAIVAQTLIGWRHSRSTKVLLFAGVICILGTCAAPLLHRTGLAIHSEVANFRVIDVRRRIFVITFLTLESALLAYVAMRRNAEMLPKFLMTATLTCFLFETRWSEAIWRHASFLWSIEFPWRLSGLLSVFTLGLIVLLIGEVWDSPSRRKSTLAICALLWLGIGISSYVVLGIRGYLHRPFVTEIKQKLESPFAAYASVSRLPTRDELGPSDGLAGNVLFLEGDGTAQLSTISARHLHLTADCPRSCTLLLKLVYYSPWRAHDAMNDPIPLRPSKRAGLTELSLGAGFHEVDVELPIGRSEILGSWLSCISSVAVGFLFFSRERNRGVPEKTRTIPG